MNPIESVTKALSGVLNTPQAEYYLGAGFRGFEGTPPEPREKAYYLRTVKATADTIHVNRQSVRDHCERLFVQGSPATPDILHLVSMLSRVERVCHQAGHEWPDTLDDQGRKRTLVEWGTVGDYFSGWVHMIQEYFPQLVVPSTIPSTDTTDQEADPGTAVVEVVTPTVDRDRLAKVFQPKFKERRPRPGMEPLQSGFDLFYDALVSKVGDFKPTDIGRVAYQIRASKWALSWLREKTFAKWFREFCEMCGAKVPAETSPNKYDKTTRATDFTAWLS